MNMPEKIRAFVRKEIVLVISAIAAAVSCLFVLPDAEYGTYFDWHTLALLLSLMIVVSGLRVLGVVRVLGEWVVSRMRSKMMIGSGLVALTFGCSMFITNDVALITFVPFAVLVLELTGQTKHLAWVVTLQTIAANIGSMLTPVGNPQNLYLSSFYQLAAGDFFAVTIPIVLLSFVLLALCCIAGKNHTIEVQFQKREEIQSKRALLLFVLLFLLSLLSVFHLLSSHIALVVTVIALAAFSPKVLKKVDYWLLATFVCFFIFAGNIGAVEAVKNFLGNVLSQNTMLYSVLSSQVISNVPAAVLLSNFTQDAKGMLLGTNIGGLGTLVASLASLISFKIYAKTPKAEVLRYLGIFKAANVVMLIVLYGFAAVCLL